MKKFMPRLFGMIQILCHFENPLFVLLIRLGVIRAEYFTYTIWIGTGNENGNAGMRCTMLARPPAATHSDLKMLRTVLLAQDYREIIPHLSGKPLRLLEGGSKIGAFAVWISKVANIAEAYCFEPDPPSRRMCAFNLEENQCVGAMVIEKALGGSTGIVRMVAGIVQPCGHHQDRNPGSEAPSTRPVEVIALKEWLQGVTGEFDLLRLDCEGGEWEIIRKTPPEVFLNHDTRFGKVEQAGEMWTEAERNSVEAEKIQPPNRKSEVWE